MEIERLLHARFREGLIRFFFVMSGVILFIETVYGLVLWLGNEIAVPIVTYIFLRILLPSILNFGVTFFTYMFNNNDGGNEEVKDLFVLLNSFVLAMIVVAFHSYFTTAIAVMLLPLNAAMLLGNKRLYRFVGLLVALGSLLHFYLQSADYMNAPDYYYILNYIVLLIEIFGIYFVGQAYMNALRNIFLENEQQKQNIIKENWNVIHDGDSNLFNFVAFNAKLKSILRKIKEGTNKNIIMAYLTIDDYKTFGINYGPEIAQSITQAFEKVLEEENKDRTYISKIDDTTYAILFNDLSINDVINILNTIKEKVYRNDNKLISEGNITFATGVVEYDTTKHDQDNIENCQKALKQAQINGKNQTVVVR